MKRAPNPRTNEIKEYSKHWSHCYTPIFAGAINCWEEGVDIASKVGWESSGLG